MMVATSTSTLTCIFVLILNTTATLFLVVQSELLQYRGTDINDVWHESSNWDKKRLPSSDDELWWNTANSYATLKQSAAVHTIIVGRHALNTNLIIDSSNDGDGTSDNPLLLKVTKGVFFVGQYNDASGQVELKRGTVSVEQSEMAVAVNGPGTWIQTSGQLLVKGWRFKIGRYNGDHVKGIVELKSGTIVVNEYEMNTNPFSKLILQHGMLVIKGRDRTNRIQSYINSGQIVSVQEDSVGSSSSPIHLFYDADLQTTFLYAKTPARHLFSNYIGNDPEMSSWFDPQNWQGTASEGSTKIPGPGSEIWMYKSNTFVNIKDNEYATCYKLVVGRKNTAQLHISGTGVLRVGDHEGNDSSLLFVGQYSEAYGTLLMTDASFLHVGNELAVAVSGPGEMIMSGKSTARVVGRFVIGRYNYNYAIGKVILKDQVTVLAQRLQLNDYSSLELYDDAQIILQGNRANELNNYLARIITSPGGQINIAYDAASDMTIVSSTGVAPTNMPTTSPSISPSISPTSVPSLSPTVETFDLPIYGNSNDWDIVNILNMALPEDPLGDTESPSVGPRMPVAVDSTEQIIGGELRTFTQVPEYGVHPRIFFGPDEIDSLRQRLLNDSSNTNIVSREVLSFAKQIAISLTQGRAAYESTPDEEKYFDKDGTRIKKLSNPGLFDRAVPYQQLIVGDLTYITQNINDGTFTNVFAGAMVMEAFLCLLYKDTDPEYETRAENLAKAMTTWATYVLTLPLSQFGHGANANRDKLGGQHMAFAYDLNHHAMTESQRNILRQAIARMIWKPEDFTGITTEGYTTTTNWIPLNSFVPVMIMSIEGETQNIDDGSWMSDWSTSDLELYFRQIMKANYKFVTYGWYPSGEGYEGAGKNYQYNVMYTAYAKRGYNFFKHPHVQAYAKHYLIKSMQPYGHYCTTYDTIGGTGSTANQELGDIQFKSVDMIGLKWAYKDDPTVDFLWRQYLETPYKHDGTWKTYFDLADKKITPRSTYANSLYALLTMPSDYTPPSSTVSPDEDFTTKNELAQSSSLNFRGDRGLVILKSDHSSEAIQFQMHVRQDMGGHTYADRNSFTLSALGRSWIKNNVGYVPWTEYQTGILIHDKTTGTTVGMPVTPLDGKKTRTLAKVAYYQDDISTDSTFVGGDATYSYNVYWYWSARDPNVDYTLTGYTPVMASWNDFLPLDQQLKESYGNIPFYDYGWWRGNGKLERIISKTVNDMSNVFRQSGIIRSSSSKERPYVLVIDDLHKQGDGSNIEYQWIAQMALDLSLLPIEDYTGNLNVKTDVVFQEDSGNDRKLLFRLLESNSMVDTWINDGTITLTNHTYDKLWSPDKMSARFMLRRDAAVGSANTNFRIMLLPFVDATLDVPQMTTSISGSSSDGVINLIWSGDSTAQDLPKDTIEFESYATTGGGNYQVEVTGIKVTREQCTSSSSSSPCTSSTVITNTMNLFDPIKVA